jgi:hypothetical protein
VSYATGAFLFVFGLAMVFVARPKDGQTAWVNKIGFFGEMYAVAAISTIVLGLCIAFLS